jgi:hypothetical protein
MPDPLTLFISNATRELRANNPLGLSVSRTYQWENVNTANPGVAGRDGVLTPGVDNKLNDHLVIFDAIQDGLNGGAWLLHDTYFSNGFNTPASIGDKWSGDSTGGYGKSVASIMKVSSGQALDYATDGVSLMQALALMENGHGDVQNIPPADFAAALTYGSTV